MNEVREEKRKLKFYSCLCWLECLSYLLPSYYSSATKRNHFIVPMLVWTHSICTLYHAYTGIGPSSLSSLFFSPPPPPTRGRLIAVISPEFKKDIHPNPTRNPARLQEWFDLEPWLLTSDSSKVSSNAFPVLHLAIRNGIWHTIYKKKI